MFQTIKFLVQTLPNDSVKGSLNILGLHTHPNRIKIMNTNEMIEDLKQFLMKQEMWLNLKVNFGLVNQHLHLVDLG